MSCGVDRPPCGVILMVDAEARLDVPTGTEPIYAEVPPLMTYRRSFTLSRELDGTRVNASLKDGVLAPRIPKTEPPSRGAST